VRGARLGQFTLSLDLVFPAAIRRFHSPSNRLEQTVDSGNSRLLPFLREWHEKLEKPLASRADQSKHPDEPLRLKEI
jgi:hypothetical protein